MTVTVTQAAGGGFTSVGGVGAASTSVDVVTAVITESMTQSNSVVITYSTVTVAPYGNGTVATSTPCGSSGFLTKAKPTGQVGSTAIAIPTSYAKAASN